MDPSQKVTRRKGSADQLMLFTEPVLLVKLVKLVQAGASWCILLR